MRRQITGILRRARAISGSIPVVWEQLSTSLRRAIGGGIETATAAVPRLVGRIRQIVTAIIGSAFFLKGVDFLWGLPGRIDDAIVWATRWLPVIGDLDPGWALLITGVIILGAIWIGPVRRWLSTTVRFAQRDPGKELELVFRNGPRFVQQRPVLELRRGKSVQHTYYLGVRNTSRTRTVRNIRLQIVHCDGFQRQLPIELIVDSIDSGFDLAPKEMELIRLFTHLVLSEEELRASGTKSFGPRFMGVDLAPFFLSPDRGYEIVVATYGDDAYAMQRLTLSFDADGVAAISPPAFGELPAEAERPAGNAAS